MTQLLRIAAAFLYIALLLHNEPSYGQSGGEPDCQGRVIVDFMGTSLLTGNEYNRIIGNAVDSLSSQGGHPVLEDWVDSVEMFLDNACFSGTKDSIVFYMLSHEAGMAGRVKETLGLSAAPVLFPYPNILLPMQNLGYQRSCKIFVR